MEKKFEKLNTALETLKKEFVGLDSIIDQLGTAIIPWYLTREVLSRPLVISLWGMTGTGKTSLVNRLIKLLDLEDKSLKFDCGTFYKEGSSYSNGSDFSSKFETTFNLDDVEIDGDISEFTEDLIYVLDEFQHARTVQNFEEVDKPESRQIWSLLDSGKFSLNRSSTWEISNIINWRNDLKFLVASGRNFKVENGVVKNRHDVFEILSYTSRDRVDDRYVSNIDRVVFKEKVAENEEDPYRELDLFSSTVRRLASRYLGDVTEIINGCSCISDVSEVLKSLIEKASAPKEINSSKSLIFVLGNLDEAYTEGTSIDPDMDADVLYEITSKVTVNDIKKALRHRFRPEQIGRFGNNIIQYPSLKKEHFFCIIDREISRIRDVFYQTSGVTLEVSQNVRNLIYNEGVYPSQGVRPLFTTVNSIVTPLLSRVTLERKKDNSISVVTLDCSNADFTAGETMITMKVSDTCVITETLHLTLGSLRNPKDKKIAYATATHEAGHAIMYWLLKGECPTEIVGTSSNSGGFCITYDKDSLEIESRQGIIDDIKISLGGYLAEKFMFGEDNILMGSGSDLDRAWNVLSDAVFKLGFFKPIQYSNRSTETNSAIPSGIVSDSIEIMLEDLYKSLIRDTTKALEQESKLLVKLALRIGETGRMKKSEMEEYVKKYGVASKASLENSRKKNSGEIYEEILRTNDAI